MIASLYYTYIQRVQFLILILFLRSSKFFDTYILYRYYNFTGRAWKNICLLHCEYDAFIKKWTIISLNHPTIKSVIRGRRPYVSFPSQIWLNPPGFFKAHHSLFCLNSNSIPILQSVNPIPSAWIPIPRKHFRQTLAPILSLHEPHQNSSQAFFPRVQMIIC